MTGESRDHGAMCFWPFYYRVTKTQLTKNSPTRSSDDLEYIKISSFLFSSVLNYQEIVLIEPFQLK